MKRNWDSRGLRVRADRPAHLLCIWKLFLALPPPPPPHPTIDSFPRELVVLCCAVLYCPVLLRLFSPSRAVLSTRLTVLSLAAGARLAFLVSRSVSVLCALCLCHCCSVPCESYFLHTHIALFSKASPSPGSTRPHRHPSIIIYMLFFSS